MSPVVPGGRVGAGTGAVLVAFLVLLLPAVAGAVVTTEATDPTPGATPSGLAAGPDGAVWFTDPGTDRVGRLGPTNAFQGFATTVPDPTGAPGARVVPNRVAAGPDGAFWFTTSTGGVGRVTPEGVVTRYPGRLRDPSGGIAAGPDGAMWFTVPARDRIARVTAPTDAEVAAGSTRGQISEFAAPAGGAPDDVELGPDGALWFTEPGLGRLGRAVPDPQGPIITEVATSTAGSTPTRLTTGPDGRIWFSDPGARTIGRVGADGRTVELPLPADVGAPGDVAGAPDGALWFATSGGTRDELGRITDAGTVTRHELPEPRGAVADLVRGSDGDLRYSRADGRIGRFETLRAAAQQPPPQAVPPALSAVAGRTVVLEVVSGVVRVRRPGRGAYEPLTGDAVLVPDGTEIDATGGRVRLTAETAPDSGVTRTAIFWAGRFVVRQARVAGAATELRLTGRPACGSAATPVGATSGAAPTATRGAATGAAAEPRAARRKGRGRPKVGRRLWGDGKGDFRTRGSRATASVRGTRWLVEDRCDRTTRVRVFEGVVTVRDRVRNRRTTLRDGAQVVAPGPRRRR